MVRFMRSGSKRKRAVGWALEHGSASGFALEQCYAADFTLKSGSASGFALKYGSALGFSRRYRYASGFSHRYRYAFAFALRPGSASGFNRKHGSSSGFTLKRGYALGFARKYGYASGFALKYGSALGFTRKHGSASGFTYIGLLMMIAISGIALAGLGQAWHTASQRDKEQELMFAGVQISEAISRYHAATPSPIKQYPATLAALLDDRRGPKPARHLRRVYIDPMTGSRDWGLIKESNGMTGITGVFSRSKLKPFKQDNFSAELQEFAGAGSYEDWRFVASDKGSGVTPSNPRPTLNEPAVPEPTATPQPGPAPSAGAGGAANPEKYARCGSSLDAAQLSCHGSCGLASSPACRSCLQAAFDGYRQCLR